MRDLQIRAALRKVSGRVTPGERREDPIAIVGFGPSLQDTWEEIKRFKFVMTCSGSHKFLVDRGVKIDLHVEVDPRKHKVGLIGSPQKDTEYLIASCCHPDVFKHLEGFNVKLWHVFDGSEEGRRLLPQGDYAVTGGCDVALRAMTLAAFLGFRDLHIFGRDGNYRDDGTSHAAAHPNSLKKVDRTEYPPGSGKWWLTTPAFLESARQTWHELDQMPKVTAKFYGEGLVQEMAKYYVCKPAPLANAIAIQKPLLISEEYRKLNAELHERRIDYGAGGMKYVPLILDIVKALRKVVPAPTVCDYGAGKRQLARALPWPIYEYDPAIPEIADPPRPADVTCCFDVLEHVEIDKLDHVLDDLRRCTRHVGIFSVPTGPAAKTYANGENTHLIQKPEVWWTERLSRFFEIGKVTRARGRRFGDYWELRYIVGAKAKKSMMVTGGTAVPRRRWHVLEDLVKQHGWTRGAEIGVKEGRTMLHLLKACAGLRMLGVDFFAARPGIEEHGGEPFADVDWAKVEGELREALWKFEERGVLFKGDSLDAATTIADGSLDFVFVDADHREAAVRADILAWRPKIKPGGMLLGHDLQDRFPGVKRAVDALCPGWQRFDDSAWGVTV